MRGGIPVQLKALKHLKHDKEHQSAANLQQVTSRVNKNWFDLSSVMVYTVCLKHKGRDIHPGCLSTIHYKRKTMSQLPA